MFFFENFWVFFHLKGPYLALQFQVLKDLLCFLGFFWANPCKRWFDTLGSASSSEKSRPKKISLETIVSLDYLEDSWGTHSSSLSSTIIYLANLLSPVGFPWVFNRALPSLASLPSRSSRRILTRKAEKKMTGGKNAMIWRTLSCCFGAVGLFGWFGWIVWYVWLAGWSVGFLVCAFYLICFVLMCFGLLWFGLLWHGLAWLGLVVVVFLFLMYTCAVLSEFGFHFFLHCLLQKQPCNLRTTKWVAKAAMCIQSLKIDCLLTV